MFTVACGGSPSASLAAVGRRVSQLSSGVFEARNIVEDHEVSQASLLVAVISYAGRYLLFVYSFRYKPPAFASVTVSSTCFAAVGTPPCTAAGTGTPLAFV